MRRAIALLALVAVAAIVAVVVLRTTGSSHSGATTPSTPVTIRHAVATIDGRGFSAAVPDGWKLQSLLGRHGARRYQLSSTGAAIGAIGVPPAGTIGITIDDFSSPRLAGIRSATALLAQTVGTPRGAVAVRRAAPAQSIRLKGSAAAEVAYTYTFRGLPNVQVDVAANRGGQTFLVELDAEPGLAAESESALQRLFSSWRWR